MATSWPIVFNIVNSIIGVSVLAMAFCFYECGIVLGPMLMMASGFLTKCSCELLLKGGQVARKRSYELLALHTYGKAGKLTVQASIIGLMLGTIVAFNVIIGDLAPSIFHGLSGVEVTWTVRAVIMIVMSFGVALPLCMMRNIQSLAAFSSLALIFYVFFVAQLLFMTLPKLINGAWIQSVYYWRPSGILNCLPIFSLAFACQTQLFVLYESLPEPSVTKMQNVVNTGINIVSLIYLLVGVFGYICFHDVGVQGDILTNYGNGFFVEVIKFGFMFSVLVSFPLMMFPIRESINNLITLRTGAGIQDNVPGSTPFIPHNQFVYITVSVLVTTTTIGIFLPNIEFVLALTGATMGTLIAFIYPASMYLHVVHEKTSTRLIAKVVVVIGLVCLLGSTYAVLTKSNSHEPEVKNLHPPGVDPIKAVPDALKQEITGDSKLDAKGDVTDSAKVAAGMGPPDAKTVLVSVPTVAAQKQQKEDLTLKVAKEESKKDEVVTTRSKETEAEKEIRKEPPVPDAPADKKDTLTEKPAKPDGRVLMSQSEVQDKDKDRKESSKSAPQNSSEQARGDGLKGIEKKENEIQSQPKQPKRRDLGDVESSNEAPVIESPLKEKHSNGKPENPASTLKSNLTLKQKQENESKNHNDESGSKKTGRDLKSSKSETEKKDAGRVREKQEKEKSKDKRENAEDRMKFSKRMHQLLDRHKDKRGVGLDHRKVGER